MKKIIIVITTIVVYSLLIIPLITMKKASAEIVVNNSEENKPGTISLSASSAVPDGYLLCDGREVSRTTYAALFAVIGTSAGEGDGSTTFNLPNLQGKTAVGKNTGTFNTLGKTGGEETHKLTTSEIPKHKHDISSGTVSTTSLVGKMWNLVYEGSNAMGSASGVISKGVGSTETEKYTIPATMQMGKDAIKLDASHNHTLSGNTKANGSNGAHNNLQPYITLNYVIKY